MWDDSEQDGLAGTGRKQNERKSQREIMKEKTVGIQNRLQTLCSLNA